MTVSDLQATIGNHNYDIPGSFKMYVSYLPIQLDDLGSDRKSNEFKKEIAQNILTGLLAFRDVYGIVSYPDFADHAGIFIMKKDADLLKLWGEWSEKDDLNAINEKINLQTDELLDTRRRLHKTSKQDHFKYTLVAGVNKMYYVYTNGKSNINLITHKDNEGRDPEYIVQFEMDYFKIQITLDWKEQITHDASSVLIAMN